MPDYFVCIMSHAPRTHYTGMTSNLEPRVWEHQQKTDPGFTKRCSCTMRIYCESFASPGSSIAREKELKGRFRSRQIALVEAENPDWRELSQDWSS